MYFGLFIAVLKKTRVSPAGEAAPAGGDAPRGGRGAAGQQCTLQAAILLLLLLLLLQSHSGAGDRPNPVFPPETAEHQRLF